MYICYVDEAGCTGVLPSNTSPIQPVFVLAGLIVNQTTIQSLTHDLLLLKQRYFPGQLPAGANYLEWMLTEIKGADLRSNVRQSGRNRKRHALRFMDALLRRLEHHRARMIGRLYVKGIGQPFDGKAVYTSSVQSICGSFQAYLNDADGEGLVVLDSRNKELNSVVSHSVFTQKFKSAGDAYARIIEMPVFGHSDNHAGLQCADLLCSAFLFPMATYAYCLGHVRSVHVNIAYERIRSDFGDRLKRLQYRYQDQHGRWYGGIAVNDQISHSPGGHLFT